MKMGNTEIIIASSAAIVAAALVIGVAVGKKKGKKNVASSSQVEDTAISTEQVHDNSTDAKATAEPEGTSAEPVVEDTAKKVPEVSFETLVSWEMETHEAAKTYKADKTSMNLVANKIWTAISKDGYQPDTNAEIPDELKPIVEKINNGSAEAGDAYDKLIRTIMTRTGNSGTKGKRFASKEDIDTILKASDDLLN